MIIVKNNVDDLIMKKAFKYPYNKMSNYDQLVACTVCTGIVCSTWLEIYTVLM